MRLAGTWKMYSKKATPQLYDDAEEPKAFAPTEFLEAQMTIPSHGHEDVGKDQEQDRPTPFMQYGAAHPSWVVPRRCQDSYSRCG